MFVVRVLSGFEQRGGNDNLDWANELISASLE